MTKKFYKSLKTRNKIHSWKLLVTRKSLSIMLINWKSQKIWTVVKSIHKAKTAEGIIFQIFHSQIMGHICKTSLVQCKEWEKIWQPWTHTNNIFSIKVINLPLKKYKEKLFLMAEIIMDLIYQIFWNQLNLLQIIFNLKGIVFNLQL